MNGIKSGASVLPPRPITAREKAAQQAKLTEEDKRKKRCCFTGLRPQEIKRSTDDIKVDLENEILAAIKEGYSTFITGMDYGTDIWAGNIVVRLKDRFPDLKLIAAVPYPEFSGNWNEEWRKKYDILLARADLVKTISAEYSDAACQLRNQWMVDHSSKIIAVHDGKAGATRDTIQYARKKGLPVKYLPG